MQNTPTKKNSYKSIKKKREREKGKKGIENERERERGREDWSGDLNWHFTKEDM